MVARFVTAEDLLAQSRQGVFRLLPGDRLTPLVEETAARHGIRLELVTPPARERVVLCVGGSASLTALGQRRAACSGERWTVAVPAPLLRRGRSGPGCPGAEWAIFSVAAQEQGAFTGEVSARMAVDAGASAVVLGLPETLGLPDVQQQLLPQRVARCLAHGLTPLVGVALTEPDFDAGRAFSRIRAEVERVLTIDPGRAARVRWFWCHPSPRPPRLGAAGEYVAMMDHVLSGCGAAAGPVVGLYDAGGKERGGAFDVEVAP